MEAKRIVVVVIIALLAGLAGGILGISLISGGPMMRMGMSPMMTPQMMVEMCRQAMADPALRTQMLEMHRQMHNEMERR